MRLLFLQLHRWVGLTIAGFLFVSGATGAIISWDHELDDLLNRHLTHVESRGEPIPSLELARRIEANDSRIRVTYMRLVAETGKALAFGVRPVVDPATGRLFEPGYNQVFVDPISGEVIGQREWGAPWPVTRENFISFLYVLHYSLHIPEMWGIDRWGLWLLGGIAVLWLLDCFVGFYLTLPSRRPQDGKVHRPVAKRSMRGWWTRWKPAWKIKMGASSYRLNFDIHRAFGLWTWAMMFVLAFTAFSLNLYRDVFYPIMSTVSKVTPTPFDTRTRTDKHQPITPQIGYADIIARARDEAQRRGWAEPAGAAFYTPNFGIYGVHFFHAGDDHGAAGVGPAILYYDGADGGYLGARVPWTGTAADIFLQAQFPVHSGRILGLPGRILVSLMGLVIMALSVTGVVIWWRKRAARVWRKSARTDDVAFALQGAENGAADRRPG
ncbi:PepSY-associated TM helix domain-containing protein [Pseudorhodoplanes sinuspersici]|uniref:Peptidase n=1 Tax=Pseudorhodoplanes sinuspersici TaxID=1235591 RepID=A0A1W6ZZP9_9HYPH|nr:PepSY-associated TM helix domain-containing protein [Pseudorhodoplanes sinuspersici]ARQ02758.1 peptidase [Pseudorhodoplanes sinuspersici]